jgi:hypothetical protein
MLSSFHDPLFLSLNTEAVDNYCKKEEEEKQRQREEKQRQREKEEEEKQRQREEKQREREKEEEEKHWQRQREEEDRKFKLELARIQVTGAAKGLATIPENSIVDNSEERFTILESKLASLKLENDSFKFGASTFAEFYSHTRKKSVQEFWIQAKPNEPKISLHIQDGAIAAECPSTEPPIQSECNTVFIRPSFLLDGRPAPGVQCTSHYLDTHVNPYLDGRKPDGTFVVPSWCVSGCAVVLLAEVTVSDLSPGPCSFPSMMLP